MLDIILVDRTSEDRILGYFPSYEAAEFIRNLYLSNCIDAFNREVFIVHASCYGEQPVPF